MITNDMEATIKQTHLQTIVLAAIMYLMLMAAAYFCTHFSRYTTTTSTTMQWTSDTSWVKGGWE